MLRSYLRLAARTLRRRKAFTLVNALGLTAGLACCALVAVFLQYELSVDTHHVAADRTYRLLSDFRSSTYSTISSERVAGAPDQALAVPHSAVLTASTPAQNGLPAIADTTWQAFAPGVVSLPDLRETSPSITADGQMMGFARTPNWCDKVPYIAARSDAGWNVVRAPFADTLYNLAVAPDGQSAFFKTYEMQDDEEVSRAYRVERTASGWGTPQPLPSLFNINAGYFCPMADGTLYFFARTPRPGIYVAEPDGDGGYGAPQWLSDAVSPEGTTSFDVLMHPDEDRLIITRAGIPDDRAGELGPRGFYLYRRTADGWQEERRLDLPYGWGATVLPDGRFLFVDAGDLQAVPLAALGIEW